MTAFTNDTVGLFMTKFEPVLKMALQQKTSFLRPHVSESYISGAKLQSPLNLIQAAQIPQRAGKYSPKNFGTANYNRRWVAPTDYEQSFLIDFFDLEKTTIDPQSGIIQTFTAGFGREVDDAIIAAATGVATIGTDQAVFSTESFTVSGTGNNTTSIYQVLGNFGGSSTTGMTVAKINEGRHILERNHNQEELESGDGVLVIGPQQHADLRNQALLTSDEFRRVGEFENGRVTRVLGFNIVVSNRLPLITDAGGNTTQRGCLMFLKSGLHMGTWQDLKTEAFRRTELSASPWEINVLASYGVTRTELGKVVQIAAYDTDPAADTTV